MSPKSSQRKPKKRQRAIGQPVGPNLDSIISQLEGMLIKRGSEAQGEPTPGTYPEDSLSFALLDQLEATGKKGREAILRRILENRSENPGVSLILLNIIAGDNASEYMLRVANGKMVDDKLRFIARMLAPWSMGTADQERAVFLNSLKDPVGTLVSGVASAFTQPFPILRTLDSVVHFLCVMDSEPRNAVLSRVSQSQPEGAPWLLRAALHMGDAETQRLALKELMRLGSFASVPAIQRLAATTGQPEMRQEATEAAARLAGLASTTLETGRLVMLPVDRDFLSEAGVRGEQTGMVIRGPDAEGEYVLMELVMDDLEGIDREILGETGATEEQISAILDVHTEAPIDLVDVDVADVRGRVAAALSTHAGRSIPIPPAFEIWEPLLHDSFPPAAAEPVEKPELPDAGYVFRHDLVEASADLLAHDYFANWLLDSPAIADLLAEVPPPQDGILRDAEFRRFIPGVMTDEKRAQLRTALRRQAYLLDQGGDEAERDTALAVAAELGRGDMESLIKLPFLQALVVETIIYLMSGLERIQEEQRKQDRRHQRSSRSRRRH